jgi:hypothetical protein
MFRRARNLSNLRGLLGSGLAAYLAMSAGCTPTPEECTSDCKTDAGAPNDDGSGGKPASGGRASSDGGRTGGSDGSGGATPSSGGALGGEGGEATGGLNMGGDPVLPVPTLDIEIDANDPLRIEQGRSAAFSVAIERGGGFDASVQLTLAGLPEGTIGSSQLVLKGASVATVTLIAATDGEMGGPFAVELTATSLDGELVASKTFSLFVAGKPGVVDTSFGELGILRAGLDELVDLKVTADGSVFVAGNEPATLLRVGSHGSWADPDEFALPDELTSRYTALGADDSSVWVGLGDGSQGDPYGIVRMSHEGSLDESFGDGGRVESDEILALAPRPSGKAWCVTPATEVISEESSRLRQGLFEISERGALGVTPFRYADGFSLFVDADDRAWVVETCVCDRGSGGSLRRLLSSGVLDETFAVGVGSDTKSVSVGMWALPRPLPSNRVLTITGNVLRQFAEDGSPLAAFGDAGTLQFLYDETTAPYPAVLDGAALADGSLIILQTPDRTAETEIPASVLWLDTAGDLSTRFSSDGKLELNVDAPLLHSSSERLFPRKVVVDEALGRAIVAVDIIPVGDTVPSDVGLVRIWL